MDYSFGIWVRRRRKALDLTQQELAQRVGCSPSLVFKIESDGRRPSRQIAELLAEQLEIPPDQRELFLKVARQEKSVGHLDPIHPVSKAKSVSVPDRLNPPALPLPLTSIIGREHELHAIIQKIQEPSCRLFTLIGLGGVGKTRLAMEVAHRLGDTFESGVCFVSLVGTSSAEFIIPAIADALGFVFSGTLELKAQLFHFLKEKQTLLILDNLEHLLDGIELLDDLLQYAPKVKILATSREQLNLRAEWVFEVQGLPVYSNVELSKPGSNSAVALFVERARQVNANFSPSPEDLALITHICSLVEGLPLGLELAASWVRLISVQEIAFEIERSIDFLTTTVRDVPQRHRSLRAVFDHSWNLLSPEERLAMQRISLFRGGFTREAAEQVAGAPLPVLSALVEKSLVRRSAAKRYDLHDLIGQYAATFLAQNSQIEILTTTVFCEYYLNLLILRDGCLRSSLQKITLIELSQEIDNLRKAWDLAVTNGMVTLLGKSASPLWYFYNLRDALREGEIAFSKAADAVRAQLDKLDAAADMTECKQLGGILGELLSHQAQFTFRQGRNLEAAGLYQSSLTLLTPKKESAALAQTLTYSGVVSWIAGEFDTAWNYLNEGFRVSNKIGDEWMQAQCHTFMGMVAHAQGDYEIAHNYLSDSMLHARALGDSRLISFVAGQLGPTAQALGRTGELMDLLRESLELSRETGDRLGIGVTFEQMAVATHARGDTQDACRFLQESIKQFRDIGDAWFLAHALNLEGNFALAEGQETQAKSSFKEACSIAFANQSVPIILDSLTGLAILDQKNGRHEQALETALFVRTHGASTWETKKRAEKLCSELENKLAPAQIEAARSRVQLINLDVKAREITCQ